MSLDAADLAFARALFSDLPDLTTRKMFGGLGIYSKGVIFAVMRSDGALLLKAQDVSFEDKLAALAGEHWTYTRKNGTASAMPYWSLPQDALDDPELAVSLARDALAALWGQDQFFLRRQQQFHEISDVWSAQAIVVL